MYIFGRQQFDYAYISPNQHSQAAELSPTSDVHTLTKGLLLAEEDNLRKASANVALKEQKGNLT